MSAHPSSPSTGLPNSIPRLLGACCFTSMAALRVGDTLLPVLAADFSVTVGQAARVIFVFAVAYGLFQLFFGTLGDRYGKLRIISFCALASVIGNMVAFLSPSLDWLVAARILSGASAAGIFPLAMAWIGDNVPYKERQGALARIVSAGVMGMLAGQWFSGLIAQWASWRLAFLALALLFLVAGSLLLRAARGDQVAQGSRQGRPALRDIVSAPASRWILVVVMIEGALAFGALAFIPSLLLNQHDISLAMAGGIAAFYGLGGFLYTRMALRLLARFGESGLARLGGVLLLVGFLSFAYAPVLALAPLACLVAGFGFYSLHNTLQTNATQMAPAARGTAMSLFACSLFIGQSCGVLAAAWLADHVSDQLIYLLAGGGLFMLAMIVARRGPPPASGPCS